MRKFFFFLLTIITVTACKKSENNPKPFVAPPLSVSYAFSATQIDTYTIRYTDSNKTVSTVIITGNNWSKSIKLAPSANHANLTLYVESANKSSDASGNLSVAVEGHNTVSMGLSSSAGYTYGLRGQIIFGLDNTF
jgi:hypothetical protein